MSIKKSPKLNASDIIPLSEASEALGDSLGVSVVTASELIKSGLLDRLIKEDDEALDSF